MKLFDYQEEIKNKASPILKEHGLVILQLEMRIGKTPISLSLIDNHKTLFLATKSAVKDVKVAVHKMNKNCDVINYESAHKVKDTDYEYIILDEFHKLSQFPRPSERYKKLRDVIKAQHKLRGMIYLSGTAAVESLSQWFHPLSLCSSHPLSKYKTFYQFHKDWGIPKQKFIGYGKTAIDYSELINPFYNKMVKPYIVTAKREDISSFEYPNVVVQLHYIDMPKYLRYFYHEVQTKHICGYKGNVCVTDGGAALLTKLQQIANGHFIDDEGNYVTIDNYKLQYIKDNCGENDILMYKYVSERTMASDMGFKHIYPIEYTEGLDLSHHEQIWITSLTFKGSSYIQALDRMAKFDRNSEMIVNIVIAKDTIEKDIFDCVSQKKNYNLKMYKGEQ